MPSPAPKTLADTLKFNAFILSFNDSRVSVSVTVSVLELAVELATKLPEDQSPLSSTKLPAPTRDVFKA